MRSQASRTGLTPPPPPQMGVQPHTPQLLRRTSSAWTLVLCVRWRQERSAGPRWRRLRTEDTTSDTAAGLCPTKPLIHLHRRWPGRPPGRDERLHEIWVHSRRHLPSLCGSGLSYRIETGLGCSSSRHLPRREPLPPGLGPAHNPPAPPLVSAPPTPGPSLAPGTARPPGIGPAPGTAPPTSLRPRPQVHREGVAQR